MRIGPIDLDRQLLIIAEIGNNHEGSYSLAEEMIGRAAESGANAVKFQTIIPERLVSADQTARIEQLRKYQFSHEQFKGLKKTAENANVLFLSTPFDLESAMFLNDLVPAFKIASGDNTFYPLLERVARTGKPIILSSGLTDLKQIKKSKEVIYSVWQKMNMDKNQLAVLHCTVSYPTPPNDVNLLALNALKKLKVTVGYSDHTLGIEAAIFSVALGGRIIEKHFTLDKHFSSFRDHQLSANPAEFKAMVEQVKMIQTILGDGCKGIRDSEHENLIAVRRSIAAARDICEGEIIELPALCWVRPGTGLAPGKEGQLLGKRLIRSVRNGEFISLDDVI